MATAHVFMLERLEKACEPLIVAARQGKLTEKRAIRLTSGELVRRSAPSLPEEHVQKAVALCRQLFTRRASWALFTTEWADSLALFIRSLLPGVASPSVLEVCAGLNTLAGPMRARGVDWVATDVKVDSAAVSPPVACDALEAVRTSAPNVVFWAWWSKDGAGDAHVARHCCERGIPVIFVGEPRGGITGSTELFEGGSPWNIQPLAGVVLCTLDGEQPFRDLPTWAGFSDRTWLLAPNVACDDPVSGQLAAMSIQGAG